MDKRHNVKSISKSKVNTSQKPKFRCLIIVCQMLEDQEGRDNEMVDMGKAINSWTRYRDSARQITIVGAGGGFLKSVADEFAKNPYEEVIICGHSIFHNLDTGKIEGFSKRHVGDLKINDLVMLLDNLVRFGVKNIMFAACEVAMNQSYKDGNGDAANSDLTFSMAKEICGKESLGDLNVSTLELVCGKFFLHVLGDTQLCGMVADVSDPVCISGLIGVGFIVKEIEVFNTFDQNHLESARNSKGSNQSVVNNICAKKLYPDVKSFKLRPEQRYEGEEWDFVDMLKVAYGSEGLVDAWCDLVLAYGITEDDAELFERVFSNLGAEVKTEQFLNLIALAKGKKIELLEESFRKIFPKEKD